MVGSVKQSEETLSVGCSIWMAFVMGNDKIVKNYATLVDGLVA